MISMKEKFKRIPVPGWLFVAGMVVYNELMLHLWVTADVRPWRLLAVLLFALGYGGITALITAMIPSEKGARWTAVGLATVVTVITLTMYFISDAYKVFMTPVTIFSGAGGVAKDYMDLVLALLAHDLWRIGLMLLPIVLYALFCRDRKTCWKLRGVLAVATVAMYALGMVVARGPAGDAARFSTAYDFDSAVRCLGLPMALTLEATKGSGQNEEPDFVMIEAAPPAPAPEESSDPTESAEPAVEYPDQVMAGLDFGAMAEQTGDSGKRAIYEYLDSLTPAKQNEYTGLFRGKNLILITAEAFTAEVIDPERTPTLYRLANQGIRFTDYYQPAWGASTTSGEFSNLMGIVPTNGGMCMKEAGQQELFLTMGHQLSSEQGYYTAAYHNHNKDFYDRNKTHIHLGYDRFVAQYGGLEGVDAVWPESDLQMFESTMPDYIHNQPFNVYYMTVSGHCVYSQKGNAMTRKHYAEVEDLDCCEAVKCYYACQLELEQAMAALVAELEAEGIADDTVIVISTDHYPYGLERSGTWENTSDYLAELYGVEEYDRFIRDHNALIIWSGCLEGKNIVVDTPVYSLDILPTLSNLFGVEYDSRLLVGRDVFSGEEPLVLWPDYSWITPKGRLDMQTGTFVPAEGVTVESGYAERISAKVRNRLTYSRFVLDNDLFNDLSAARKKAD